LTAVKSSQRLREVLVNAGLFPARDQHFANLERWLARKLPQVADPTGQQALRGYVT
jgi:hypothetical protein